MYVNIYSLQYVEDAFDFLSTYTCVMPCDINIKKKKALSKILN